MQEKNSLKMLMTEYFWNMSGETKVEQNTVFFLLLSTLSNTVSAHSFATPSTKNNNNIIEKLNITLESNAYKGSLCNTVINNSWCNQI